MATNHLEGSMSLRDYVNHKGGTSKYKIIDCKAEDGTIFKQAGFFLDEDYDEGEANRYVFVSMSKQLSRKHNLTDSFLREHASELRVVETRSLKDGRVSATMYLPGDGSRTSNLQDLEW